MATRKVEKFKSSQARVPVRPVVLDAAHCWMERSNPLVGVSVRTAQAIFDAARDGNTQRLHWLFQEIEAANPILFTCIERRQAAIAGFRVKVSALPSMEGALADEQKDAVESFIAGIDNFTELLEHLDTSFFRGFALAQPVWEPDGAVREVRLHNSWEFLVHGGQLYHNPECDGFSRTAVPCADAGLIGIQRKRAIDYPALSIHIRHAVSERDWGRFLERYALPKPAVTMAANATNADREDYILSARAVENGQVSVWPNGTNITDFAGGSRGTDPFNSFIEHQEKLIVLLSTGGTLTSLAQADTGSLAGGAQMKVWQEIVRRDAGVLSQAVMKSLIKPFLAAKFGAQPCAVDFALDFPTERSAQDAANIAATLKSAGWRVDQGELEKAVGFTLERDTGSGEPGTGNGFTLGAAKSTNSTPHPPSLIPHPSQTPFKTSEKGFKIAPRNPDGQGEGSGENALVEALVGLFEKSLAEAAADAVEEETTAAASDQPRGKTSPESNDGSFAPKEGGKDSPTGKADKADPPGDSGSSGGSAEAANYTPEHRAKVGQTGSWESLGMPSLREITPDEPRGEGKTKLADARKRISSGETIKDPLGGSHEINARTTRHWTKKGKNIADVNERLALLDEAEDTISKPHEIWKGVKRKGTAFIRMVKTPDGKSVINVAEMKDGTISWHGNEVSFDYWREGMLLYVR